MLHVLLVGDHYPGTDQGRRGTASGAARKQEGRCQGAPIYFVGPQIADTAVGCTKMPPPFGPSFKLGYSRDEHRIAEIMVYGTFSESCRPEASNARPFSAGAAI
ncbi:unnamed protein product, partial [Ectocarpus sp. 12 AP-2014]